MIKKHSIYKFFLHYGMSTVLIVMFITIVYMLQTIEISNRVNVDIYINTDKEYYVYIPKNNTIHLEKNSLLPIRVQDNSELIFKILHIKEETSYVVCCLKPVSNEETLHHYFEGNTRLTGYVFANKIKLSDLIFNKWIH